MRSTATAGPDPGRGAGSCPSAIGPVIGSTSQPGTIRAGPAADPDWNRAPPRGDDAAGHRGRSGTPDASRIPGSHHGGDPANEPATNPAGAALPASREPGRIPNEATARRGEAGGSAAAGRRRELGFRLPRAGIDAGRRGRSRSPCGPTRRTGATAGPARPGSRAGGRRTARGQGLPIRPRRDLPGRPAQRILWCRWTWAARGRRWTRSRSGPRGQLVASGLSARRTGT